MKDSYRIPIDGPAIAFKEWLSVCEALKSGQQSVILRKGGIAEGKQGFGFKHDRFFLFPTLFHHQWQSIKDNGAQNRPELPSNETRTFVSIELFAEVVFSRILTDWRKVEALKDYHMWKEAVVRERFDYDDNGSLHLALVRVYRLETPWVLPYERRFGGCRSWIELPTPENEGICARTVLDDKDFGIIRKAIETR